MKFRKQIYFQNLQQNCKIIFSPFDIENHFDFLKEFHVKRFYQKILSLFRELTRSSDIKSISMILSLLYYLNHFSI